MIEKLIQLLKNLYIKMKCAICCSSKCQIEIGRKEEHMEEENKDVNVNKEIITI